MTVINLVVTAPFMLKDRETYHVLVGRMDGTIRGAYSPADDVPEEDNTLYIVTDGDDAGMYARLDSAGEAIGRFLERRHPEQTPLIVTPETHSLDRMDGEAAETLDYNLEDIPDDEYKEILEHAGMNNS